MSGSEVAVWRIYARVNHSNNLLDRELILGMFSADSTNAIERFKVFNEEQNNDKCLDDVPKIRKTDEEARLEIKQLLGAIEIAQVKSLPRVKRNNILKKVKKINGLSQMQSARILGISPNLIFKV